MITQQEAAARFGMSLAEAHKVRDRAAKACPDMAAARAAWQALADELRGSKGQPFACPQHPESVRFRMLQAIADGESLPRAVELARAYAWQSTQED